MNTHTCGYCGTVMPYDLERCQSCGWRTYLRLRELNRQAKLEREASTTAVLVPVEAAPE